MQPQPPSQSVNAIGPNSHRDSVIRRVPVSRSYLSLEFPILGTSRGIFFSFLLLGIIFQSLHNLTGLLAIGILLTILFDPPKKTDAIANSFPIQSDLPVHCSIGVCEQLTASNPLICSGEKLAALNSPTAYRPPYIRRYWIITSPATNRRNHPTQNDRATPYRNPDTPISGQRQRRPRSRRRLRRNDHPQRRKNAVAENWRNRRGNSLFGRRVSSQNRP